MSNTVDMTVVENTFHNLYERTSCLDSIVGIVEWKMNLISLLGTATKLSSRTSGQVVEWKMHCHAKEQARYTLCMVRSISKDPT